MDVGQFFIGILLIGMTVYSVIRSISIKKQPKQAPELKQNPAPAAQTAPKMPERPKNYSELVQSISKEKKKDAENNIRQAASQGNYGKPKEYFESVNKEHLEVDNVWAIDEDGLPTEKNVANDKIDIPMALGRYDRWVALAELIAGFIILLTFLSGVS